MAIVFVYTSQSERAVEVRKIHLRLDPFCEPLIAMADSGHDLKSSRRAKPSAAHPKPTFST
jgi:hypothetical protein